MTIIPMPTPHPANHIRLVDWEQHRSVLQTIRCTVFCQEQGCPPELEEDGKDELAQHILATWDGQPIGTGRLLGDGKITRMAVLAEFRGHGVGREILACLLDAAWRQGLTQVYLHAQVPAIPFYEKAGFTARGPVFHEAHMPHRRMTLERLNGF